MKKLTTLLSLATVLAIGVSASSLEDRVTALEAQNEVLAEEILASQSDGFTAIDTDKSYNGLGTAASKVYYSKNPLSLGGYGEMYYAKPENSDDYADVYRFITYFGYKFNDWIILNSELEFEHGANASSGGKVVVEFMYLDFLLHTHANLRFGNVLVPMGLIGLRHEPTLFNTVQRPEVEKKLIPSTWHENGALVYGRVDSVGLEYTAGVVNALNLNNEKTASANNGWIRDGRQGASKESPFDPAFVGRVDYTGVNGLVVGASFYFAEGSNLKDDAENDVSGLSTTMFDIHARYESGAFSAYGLYTKTILDGAENISNTAVEEASGYYANVAYDLSEIVGIEYKFPIFAQYQSYNPVESTVDGLNQEKYQTDIVTMGLNFFPTDQTVLKMDYTIKEVNGIDSEDIFSIGFGFIF
ncbi:MAG: hypothetical protein Q9M36_03515 [Sulfurovum sp.]|nr:hypothetical protein [Sulfurovum sp.]